MAKYTRITHREREVIVTSFSNGLTYRSIGLELGRNVSTISREVPFYKSQVEQYSAQVAQEDAIYFRLYVLVYAAQRRASQRAYQLLASGKEASQLP